MLTVQRILIATMYLRVPTTIFVLAFIGLALLSSPMGLTLSAQPAGSSDEGRAATGSVDSDNKGAQTAAESSLQIIRDVNSSGGSQMTSGGYTLNGSVSQAAIGRLRRNTTLLNVGFWYWAKQNIASACVRLPIAEAEPGTTLTIPLLLEQAVNIPVTPSLRFRARIRFNRSLLQPVDGTPDCMPDGGDCLLDVEGPVTAQSVQTGVLANLRFLAKLGNAENTPLVIEEFEWIGLGDEKITTQLKHGVFNLLGICREGGEIRLIRSTGPASRLRVWPNPASENASVEFTSREEGQTRLTLVDAIGREITTFAEQSAEAVKLYRVDIDLSTIPSGSYFLVLRTPTEIKTTRLTIDQ